MTTPPRRQLAIEQLSPRRREVLTLIGQGKTNDEIGGTLTLSTSTVRAHVTGVLADLGVRNRTEAATQFVSWAARLAQVDGVLARPAVAVLPIVAPAGEELAASIAVGLSVDLGTLLARWCWFPVIAYEASRASMAGESSAEAARRLGAAFFVGGTFRRRRSGWRLTIRVEEAHTGFCVWAEQYDLSEANFLEHQDDVCERIVAAAYPALCARAAAVAPAQIPVLSAWRLAHSGLALQSVRNRRANLDAQEQLRLALKQEPSLVLAHFGLGLTHYDEVLNQWGDAKTAARSLADCARRCTELAPHAAEGYYLSGRLLQSHGEHALAVAPLEAAIGRNPSFAPAHALLAQTLCLAGRPDEGLARIRHAQRLGPGAFVAGLTVVHFLRHEVADALLHAERAIALNPEYPFVRVVATASAWELGDRVLAQKHARALRTLHPGFVASSLGRTFGGKSEGVARLVRALEGTSS